MRPWWCMTPGCSEPRVPGRARCRKHGSGSTWEGYAERHPERVLRYKSGEWAMLRARQLREHPMCQWPGCTAGATQVDHRLAVADGGAFADPLNLQSICKTHHHAKTALDAKRRANRRKGRL